MGDKPVAIVTGAAAGIGRACVDVLLGRGYSVLAVDRDERRLAAMKADRCVTATADVTSTLQCDNFAAKAIDQWGRIDVLVANAGLQLGAGMTEADDDHWDTVLDVNLKGVARCCRSVIPVMRRAGSGALVLVSSINALSGSAGMPAYDASKAGVLALTRSLACELGRDGIRVNAVCPGNTLTDFHIDRMAKVGKSVDDLREMTQGYGLLGRAAEPGEIARAIAFLAGNDASFITGHSLVVDGGYSAVGR